MSDYTPTTEEIRAAYAKRRALYLSASGHVLSNDAKYDREDYAEFDRWFASEIEKAELRGAVKVSRAMLEDALAKSDHEFGEFL